MIIIQFWMQSLFLFLIKYTRFRSSFRSTSPIQPIKLVHINLWARESERETNITNTIVRTNVNESFPLFFSLFLCHFVTIHPKPQLSTDWYKKYKQFMPFPGNYFTQFRIKKKIHLIPDYLFFDFTSHVSLVQNVVGCVSVT